jgi:hypothetical protein
VLKTRDLWIRAAVAIAFVALAGVAATTAIDQDMDGLDDRVEDELAERFAPIVYHGDQESSFPIDVDSWLARTHLSAADSTPLRRRTERLVAGPLRQQQLLDHSTTLNGIELSSSGSRSRAKQLTFFLEDVPAAQRPSVVRPGEWVTYVHSYPNDAGGVTLQYWRAYMWNDASFLGIDVGHGGDWEAVVVHLDARMQPARTAFLDHTGIVDGGMAVRWEGTHPLVWSEEGGHSSSPDNRRSRSARSIRHATWTGGAVTLWDGTHAGVSGGLRNVGEKLHPRNGQVFIQYSGLWGAPGRMFMTSGYWGPAFNETGAVCRDGAPAYGTYLRPRARSEQCVPLLMKAWCDGMTPLSARTLECHASSEPF